MEEEKKIENLLYILTHSKIRDNEECPCGSRQAFKVCCKER